MTTTLVPGRNLRWLTPVLVLGFFVMTMTALVVAGDRVKTDLFADIQNTITRYAFFTVFDDVSIGIADDGVVTLVGSVTGGHKKRDIERRVAQVDGVTAVNNEIELLPVSISDNRLRSGIARAIFTNPHFLRHGAGPNPPIHIVVKRGHVTLRGVVSNEVERTLARALAEQFNAFSVTNELRLPAEVTDELERLG